jgi:hypothetical protein
MDDQDKRRHHLATQVRKLAVRCGCGRPGIIPPLYGGHAPSIMGLPDDTVGSLTRQAVKLGGRAHLMVLDELPGDEVQLRVLWIERRNTPITDLDDQPSGRVNEDSTLSTLMQGMNVGEHLSLYTSESETLIRFLADSIQPAPSGRPGKAAAVSEARNADPGA